jgi:hypothetical protein
MAGNPAGDGRGTPVHSVTLEVVPKPGTGTHSACWVARQSGDSCGMRASPRVLESLLVLCLVLACLVATHAPCVAQAADPLTLYVASTGNDAWSGRLPAPNAEGTDGPLATLERARDLLRELKRGGLKQPAEVMVRGGEYALPRTLVFTAEDSGTEACPVTFRAFPGEEVRLLGGKPVGGWQKREDGIFVAQLADQGFAWFRFHQLFFRGERQTLARYPKLDPAHPHTGGLLYVDAPSYQDRTGFYYDKDEIPFEAWGDYPQAEVNIFPYNCWDHNIIPIVGVDTQIRHLRLKYPVAGRINEANRYFVQNVLGALDAPGEWYVDYATGTLYFRPPGGEVADGDVIVPVLENLVEVSGTPEEPVRRFNLRGFRFAYAEQDAIVLEGAEQCEITGISISNIGGIGINAGYLRNASKGIGNRWTRAGRTRTSIHSGDRVLLCSHPCTGCRTAGNDVCATGGDGITLIGTGNTADNNHIYRNGLFDMVCAGVTVYGSENLVSHNAIHDTPRDAIFINGAQNTAEYNSIRNTMLYTADNSGIALRQHNVEQAVKDRGNVIRFNKIFDTIGYGSYPHCTHPPRGFGSPFCAWGIYLDGSICGVTVYGNIIARSAANSIFIQFGGGNVVENNILVETLDKALQYDCMLFFGYFMYSDPQGRFAEPPNRIERNILYYTGADKQLLIASSWGKPEWNANQLASDYNLLWHNGLPVRAELDAKRRYGSLEEWQAAGFDRHSLVADPGFVDAAHDDYRLKPDSPAYALGFRDINSEIEKIGPYESPERATWPLENLVLQREDPVVFEYTKPPKPIVDGFELTPTGRPPARAQVNTEGEASIFVATEAFRTGGRSLRFTDAPGLEHNFNPHLTYSLKYPDGKLRFSIDTLNSQDAPADWYMEFRDWRGQPLVGPTFAGTRDGRLLAGGRFGAGGQELALIPNGTWYTVGLDFETGVAAPKTFTLTLKVDGEPDRVFADLPFPNPEFEQATWFGISSLSTERTVFYVDNLLLGPADSEGLADAMDAPAIRGLPGRGPAATMRNEQQLALYWKFDEAQGYDLIDSSGNGLDGDLGGAQRATGDFGRALYLDGGNAPAEVEDSQLLHFGTEGFTVECWLCPTTLDIDSQHKRRRLLDKGLWPATWWNVDIWSDGRVQMEMTDANGQPGTTASDGALKESVWTQLAIVVDRAGFATRYYFNGALDSAKGLPATFTGNLDMTGKSFTTGIWQPFVGLLDELQVYRRALTDAEVRASYDASKARYTSTEFAAEEE